MRSLAPQELRNYSKEERVGHRRKLTTETHSRVTESSGGGTGGVLDSWVWQLVMGLVVWERLCVLSVPPTSCRKGEQCMQVYEDDIFTHTHASMHLFVRHLEKDLHKCD